MAQTQKFYRLGRRLPRYDTKLSTFSNGMYLTNQILPEGYAKYMINYDINATGTNIKPKRGREFTSNVDIRVDYDTENVFPNQNSNYTKLEITDYLNAYKVDFPENGWDEEHPYEDRTYNTQNGVADVIFNTEGVVLLHTDNKSQTTGYADYFEAIFPTAPVNPVYRELKNVYAFNKKVVDPYLENSEEQEDPRYSIKEVLKKPLYTITANELYIMREINSSLGTKKISHLKLIVDNNEHGDNMLSTYKHAIEPIDIEPQKLNPAEAYTNGYNMYAKEPYIFSNAKGSGLNILGALPYLQGTTTPVLNPLTGSIIDLKVYYQYKEGTTLHYTLKVYNLDDYSTSTVTVATGQIAAGTDPISFKGIALPYTNNQFIIEVYENDAQASKVTFPIPIKCISEEKTTYDFSKNFDLTTAKGMVTWFNYLGVYGVENAPDTIFFSDIENPSYFPFPNNVIQLGSPILAVYNYLDFLLAITVDSIYLITIGSSISASNIKCILNNIYIPEIDAINLVILKDQIFFKTADQFYVLKPNSYTSDATDLKNYVNSTAIDEISDDFEQEVLKIANRMYRTKLQELTNKQKTDVYFESFKITDVRSCILDEEVHYIYDLNLNVNTDLSGLGKQEYSDLYYSTYDYTASFRNLYWFLQMANNFPAYEPEDKERLLLKYDFNNDGTIDMDDYDLAWQLKNTMRQTFEQVLQANTISVALHLVYNTLTRSWRLYLKPLQGNNVDYARQSNVVHSPVYFKNKQSGDYYEIFAVEDRSNKTKHRFGFEHWLELQQLTNNGQQDYTVPEAELQKYQAYITQNDGIIHKELNKQVLESLLKSNGYLNESQKESIYNKFKIFKLTYDSTTDDFLISNNVPIYEYKTSKKIRTQNINLNGFIDAYTYLDTGNISLEDINTKRFREVQFNLVNGEATSIPFYVNFQVDGKEMIDATKYQIQHITDEEDPDYGLIYVIPLEDVDLNINVTATEEVNLIEYGSSILSNDIIESDHWALDLSKFPDLTMCTVRFELKGRGRRGSIQLLNTSLKRYELADVNWIYRTMSAR